MNSSRQQHVYGPLLVLVLLMVVGMFLVPGRAEAGEKAKVTWEPETLEVTLFAGTSQVQEISFQTSGDVDNVSFSVVPALEEFISVKSYGLETIQEGVEYSLIARFDIPAQTPLKTYNGTVHLREGKRTIAKPLKVTIHVVEPTSEEIPAEIGLPSHTRIAVDEDGHYLISDEILIGLDFDTPIPEARIKEVATSTSGSILGSVAETLTYQVQYSVASLDDLESIRLAVKDMEYVAFASHHLLSPGLAATYPAKGVYDDTWDEMNPGGDNWNLEYIKAPSAWDITTGGDVPVAVLDIQMVNDHEDLIDNIRFVNGRPNFDHQEQLGHGTGVAGIICANGHNSIGIAGVAWKCSLSLYNIHGFVGLKKEGYGDDFLISAAFLQQMMTQVANDGARIVNISLGMVDTNECFYPQIPPIPPPTPSDIEMANQMNDVLERAIIWAKEDGNDVLWVLAAGNECRDIKYQSPASLVTRHPENVITVANIGKGGQKTWDSNYGLDISVAAPGESILSTFPLSCDANGDCVNGYKKDDGTSYAAPHVSGLAALILSANSELSAADVKNCIVSTADKMEKPQFPEHDFVVINVYEAVKCAVPYSEPEGLQRISALGRSLSENGKYLAHDPGDQLVSEDSNIHQDVYFFDLRHDVPRDYPVLVSINLDGDAGNDRSRLRAGQPSVSNNGRVVFQSDASDLVDVDANGTTDIFIRDYSLAPPDTYLVSLDNNDNPNDSNLPAMNPSISTDGRYVALESKYSFTSQPDSLITDIFLRDIQESKTFLVSKDRRNRGDGGNSSSFDSLVAPNGEFVIFTTRASNIGDGIDDTNGRTDVYLYDITEDRVVERISVGKGNVQANGDSKRGNISRDGRFVFFYSTADGLEDGGGVHRANDYKLYLRDRQEQKTILIDPIWNGYELRKSRTARITEDGRYIAFWANQWTPGHSDIILWDTVDDELVRLSQGYDPDDPEPSNGSSLNGFINNDTQVAFLSAASNLVPDDDNGEDVDLFVYTIPK